MTKILFILDELYPVRNAPSVRIENLRAALPLDASIAIGGASGGSELAPSGYLTISRPSERSPLSFLVFLLKLGSQAIRTASRLRPRIIVLSVPKYELLLFAPALARCCSHLVIDVRDSLGFLDYGAYLAHFLPQFLANPLGRAMKRLVSAIQLRALRAASIVTVANRGIAATIDHPNVHLISNGVDTDTFVAPPRPPRNPNEPIKLVYLGNFAEKDRFDIILDLASSHPLPIEIHLIGDGRNRKKVIDRLTAASIPFHYHGLVPHQELPTLLSTMDLGFIFRAPGVDESIPVALFEFAACGIPSLCNDTGIMASYVREHNLGFVSSTVDECYAALTNWMATHDKQSRSRQLHLTAVREFSLTSTRAAFRTLVTPLLAGHAANGGNSEIQGEHQGVSL